VGNDEAIQFESQRRLRLWQLTRWLAWLSLTGALAYFLARELLPSRILAGDGAPLVVIGLFGLIGGAMLVGAKLAVAPVGQRPDLRQMILLIFGTPFALILLAQAVNSVAGGPVETFVSPVIALVIEEGDKGDTYLADTLDAEGRPLRVTLATDVPRGERDRWTDLNGFRPGTCMMTRSRKGWLGWRSELDRTPALCPPQAGTPSPEGQLFAGHASDRADPADWRWQVPDAIPGAALESWYQSLRPLLQQHASSLDGRTLAFEVLVDPQETIIRARTTTEGLPPAIAADLSDTLVGRSDVVVRPSAATRRPEPVWLQLPLRVDVTYN
jgi:hypothetical protein